MNPDPTSLDHLHELITPPPVPWWPPAAGWFWVLGIVVGAALILGVRGFLRWQHDRYRREALSELAAHERTLPDPSRRAAALAALAELLKRAALTAYPREQVANLTGPEWYQFLDRTGRIPRFAEGKGAMLECAVYDPRTAGSLDEAEAMKLASLVRDWLKHHRVEAASRPGL